ncbi:glucan endo-1,3-alpha-glucosidase, partial [Tremellales sp. Uapishka_1]
MLKYAVLVLVLGASTDARLGRSHPHRKLAARASVPSGWYSVGCIVDSSARLLNGTFTSTATNTIESCLGSCDDAGYVYASVEYGKQCFCGNTLNSAVGQSAPSTDCSYACTGNSAETCGGYNRGNLYSKPAAVALGCYSDAASRTLNGTGSTSTSTNTIESCQTYCEKGGFAYAGMEDGKQCWCGMTAPPAPRAAAASNCNIACTGNSNEKCGGNWYINVYQLPCSGTVTKNCNSVVVTTSASTAHSTSTSKSTTTTSKATTTTTKTTTTAKTTTTTSKATSTSTSKASSSMSTKASSSTSSAKASTATVTTVGTSKADATATTTTATVVTSSLVSGAASPPAATGTRALYAHHMVGNTYSYTQATWADDIALAAAAGIDGFALNMGSDSWQPPSVAMAYAAAEASGLDFKLFLSFDMSSLSCSSASAGTTLVNLVSTYANHPNQAMYKSAVFVSTFSGADCTFGLPSAQAGWNSTFETPLKGQNISIHFSPAIFSDTSTFAAATWYEGEFNWNSGWPMGSTDLTTASDTTYMAAMGNKTYMPAVSPCFFTYYSPQTYNKNWIYRSDDWLLATRMEQIISMRTKFDHAELISWNDYGESHYLGPIRADQPNSQGWTNGMPHTAWLNVVSYYAPAFKTGAYPAATDMMVLWSRPHPKDAVPSAPTNARPTSADYTDDNLYAFVTLKSAATFTLTSGNNTASWNLAAGVNKLSLSSAAGAIGGKIVRSGATVKSYNSTGDFSYVLVPTDYNFNYFVASA